MRRSDGRTHSPLFLILFFLLLLFGGERHRRACACVRVRVRVFLCVCACASRTGVLELLRVHAVSPADSEMDVRFFPAPPSSVGSCTLPADSGLDYYHSNKVTMLSTCFLLACLFVRSYLSSLPLRQKAQATKKTQAASVGRRRCDHQVHFPAPLGREPGGRELCCVWVVLA